ncbi:MAG: anti-sigma factor [Chloroflexota bacterium]
MNLSHDDIRDLAAGFVLGALAPEEEAAVRDHLATCREPHPEIEELGGVVPYLAASVEPVEPPAGLRDRILHAAMLARPAEGGAQAELTAAPTPAPAPLPFPTAEARAARLAGRPSRVATWAMGLAAVLAIAVLGAWNLQLQARISDVEGSLAAATAYQQGVSRVLEVAAQEGSQTALLVPADPSTSAVGLAATGADGTVVISMRDLAPTSGTQVYEAWVIVGDAAPVPLGGFIVGASGTGAFSGTTALAGPGAILALTLEPGPGATTPTAPVLTVGTLAASG